MSFLTDLLNEINGQRAAINNGTASPDAAPGGGPGEPPVVGRVGMGPNASGPAGDLQKLAAMDPAARARLVKLTGALQSLGQRMPANSAKGAAEKFGGQVLGFGEHRANSIKGMDSNFATVLKGNQLFHVYDDGRHVGVDHGAVADALPQGEFAPEHPSMHAHTGRDGHHVDPVTGRPSWGPDRQRGQGFAPAGGRETPGAGLMRLLGL